jgi:hypothetical protein
MIDFEIKRFVQKARKGISHRSLINNLDTDIYHFTIKTIEIKDPLKFILNRKLFNIYLRLIISYKELLSDKVYSFLFDWLSKWSWISDLIHSRENRIAIIKHSNSEGECLINPLVQNGIKQQLENGQEFY